MKLPGTDLIDQVLVDTQVETTTAVDKVSEQIKAAVAEENRVSESLRLTAVRESPLLHNMRAELIKRLKSMNIESSFVLCLNFDQVKNLLNSTPEKLKFLDEYRRRSDSRKSISNRKSTSQRISRVVEKIKIAVWAQICFEPKRHAE
jgi:DNA polymerase III psi subunit